MAPPNRELCQQGMPAENDQKKEKISINSQILLVPTLFIL